jgi:hypothetical protein
MTECEYPIWLYHPTKAAFICPSQEFLDSLPDAKEYEKEPFTGERAITAKKKECPNCKKLGLEVVDLKLEVERLRAALEIATPKADKRFKSNKG